MSAEKKPALESWDPARLLRGVSTHESKLSRGFMQSSPASWFPGLAAQWGALWYAYGIELRVTEVKPQLSVPRGLPFSFGALINDEPIGLYCDEGTARVIVETFSPDASPGASAVVLEYLVRRFFYTLSSSWSGPELGAVKFDPQTKARDVQSFGGIKVSFRLQQQVGTIWFSLGSSLVDLIDKLWRKQQASSENISSDLPSKLHLEIAQLGVPPSDLSQYVKPKTVIDLEVAISDTIIIRGNQKPLFAAQLLDIDGRFGFETLPGPAPSPIVPEGMTRIAIELGTLSIDPQNVQELLRPGSMYQTPLMLSDKVSLVINGENVAQAKLCSFEGRLAMAIL